MKEITPEEWAAKKRHGYTSVIEGQKYILTNDGGMTVLAPVTVKRLPGQNKKKEDHSTK